jgi:glucose-6-phosphate isomerase
MESNGKSDDWREAGLDPTAPVVWGGRGTDAQHAVFQLLHQGTVFVPVELIAVREGDDPEQHRLFLLNAFAQGAALMQAGKPPTRSVACRQPAQRDDASQSSVMPGRLAP